MIDGGMRGGICSIAKRYAKANNPYLPDYDPSKPSTYILYLDANNLYGWAMSQPQPSGQFHWLDREEWEGIDWISQSEDQTHGYILEVDLDYPDTMTNENGQVVTDIHNKHNDYPLAPERMHIEISTLSEKQAEIKRH